MRAKTLCQKLLSETSLHQTRLDALSEIVETVLIGKTLSVTGIGRKMENSSQTRSNIRKADRLYSNSHLHGECEMIYTDFSSRCEIWSHSRLKRIVDPVS